MMANDNTITFLPERLNRQPVVFRGMTMSELSIVFLAGFGVGLAVGIVGMLFIGEWAIIPSCSLGIAFLFVFKGGNLIAKLKRGKPDTWLPRYLEQRFGRNRLLINSSPQKRYWSIRR
ncbi:TIGR03750 family conjugal transfer protein [Gallibacterium salpingitidis]|nr:TIGR03750 family conjugal transfer protein [Gallibacterium salpingitidis]